MYEKVYEKGMRHILIGCRADFVGWNEITSCMGYWYTHSKDIGTPIT